MKTFQLKKEEIKRDWWLIDVKDKVLGRVATRIASLLIGDHKVKYTAHLDCGDYVIVTNVDKVKVTGKKRKAKKYYWHTGYMGGLKERTFQEQMDRDSRQVIRNAVKNMLPKNKLQKKRMKRLKVYLDDKHPYGDRLKKNKDGKKE